MKARGRFLISLSTIALCVWSPPDLLAGMENCRFALHWKPKFSATKTITTLCDNLATLTVEPNYSPNWNSSTNTPNPLPCYNYVTAAAIGAAQVYLVIGRAGTEGVAAASFGVTYHGGSNTQDSNGISPQFVTWTSCADGLAFPNGDPSCTGNCEFPAPKGGMRITWNNSTSCQTQVIGLAGVHAVVGSFYIYSYGVDQLQITPNNNLQGGVPELAIANCAGMTTDLVQVWGLYMASQYCCSRIDFGAGYGYNACGAIMPSLPTTWGKVKSMYPGTRKP